MRGNSRNIVFVPSWYPNAENFSAGTFIQQQARVLDEHHHICVLIPVPLGMRSFYFNKPLPPAHEYLDGPRVTTFTFPLPPWRRSIKRRFNVVENEGTKAILRVQDYIGHVDCLIAEGWLAACYAARWSERLSIPYIVVEHSNPLINPHLVKHSFLRDEYAHAAVHASAFVTVSEVLSRWVLSMIPDPGFHPSVIGNIVDTDFYIPTVGKRTSDRFRILHVTSNDPIKDRVTFLQSIALVRKHTEVRGMDVRVVGLNQEVSVMFRREAEALGLAGIVSIEDQRVSREEIRNEMYASDLLVSTSINETFGMTIAEALACGLPVVATRSGGADFILGETSPCLVDVRNPRALADKIIETMELRIPFDATTSRRDIVQRFGKAAFLTAMETLISDAVLETADTRLSSFIPHPSPDIIHDRYH